MSNHSVRESWRVLGILLLNPCFPAIFSEVGKLSLIRSSDLTSWIMGLMPFPNWLLSFTKSPILMVVAFMLLSPIVEAICGQQRDLDVFVYHLLLDFVLGDVRWHLTIDWSSKPCIHLLIHSKHYKCLLSFNEKPLILPVHCSYNLIGISQLSL